MKDVIPDRHPKSSRRAFLVGSGAAVVGLIGIVKRAHGFFGTQNYRYQATKVDDTYFTGDKRKPLEPAPTAIFVQFGNEIYHLHLRAHVTPDDTPESLVDLAVRTVYDKPIAEESLGKLVADPEKRKKAVTLLNGINNDPSSLKGLEAYVETPHLLVDTNVFGVKSPDEMPLIPVITPLKSLRAVHLEYPKKSDLEDASENDSVEVLAAKFDKARKFIDKGPKADEYVRAHRTLSSIYNVVVSKYEQDTTALKVAVISAMFAAHAMNKAAELDQQNVPKYYSNALTNYKNANIARSNLPVQNLELYVRRTMVRPLHVASPDFIQQRIMETEKRLRTYQK